MAEKLVLSSRRKLDPNKSRARLFESIESAGTLTFAQLMQLKRKERWNFGITDDAFDILFANQALGVITIDVQKGTASIRQPTRPVGK